MVELFRVGRDDLAAASRLKVVQKFGTSLRNIDTAACAEKGIKLLTLRRRANISCAEHAFGLMLLLARKLDELDGLVTVERIEAAQGAYRPFERRHTPGGNYARSAAPARSTVRPSASLAWARSAARLPSGPGPSTCTCSIISARARRRPRSASEARHVPLATLLPESDWIVPQLPTLPSTRDLLGRAELAQVKPGACIVNVANAAIINRDALIEALAGRPARRRGARRAYQEPVADDDELLSFDNVILTPRMAGSPRFNGLNDFEELITASPGSSPHDPPSLTLLALMAIAAPSWRSPTASIRTGRSG